MWSRSLVHELIRVDAKEFHRLIGGALQKVCAKFAGSLTKLGTLVMYTSVNENYVLIPGTIPLTKLTDPIY